MTLTATTNRVQYDGDDSTVSFPVTFIFWDLDDPLVVLTDSSGVETTWVRGTQYTMAGGSGATGTLTVVTSPTDYTPATGETLTIKSNLANTQPTSLPAGGPLPSGTVEQQLDQIVRQIQQLAETLGRGLTYPLSDSSSLSAEIPNSTDRASSRLGFDAAGEPIAVTGDITGVATTAFIDTLLDDGDAPTARATLGAAGLTASNTFTKTQIWTKGADITSAATLVLGTDGNYFDVTGNTGPTTAVTVAAGTFFMLQFDSTPTWNHSATLDLPGEANFTFAAGDRVIGFAQTANDVQVLSIIKASGKAVKAEGILQVIQKDIAEQTNTTTTPANDSSIPLISEGDEIVTQAITPRDTSSRIKITLAATMTHSTADASVYALFRGSTCIGAIAVSVGAANAHVPVSMHIVDTPASASELTYSVRWGVGASTGHLNKLQAGTQFGGAVNIANGLILEEIAG